MDENKLKPGDHHYKAYVGPPNRYDLMGGVQFMLLMACGIREHHKLLDIGCGSLRLGKLMIPFLEKGNYHGIEPNKWLVEEGLQKELGNEIVEVKNPKFSFFDDFAISRIENTFDYMIAQSIFSHASLEQIQVCLAEVKKTLDQQGIMLATFVFGDNDYEGTDWVYPGIVNFKRSTINRILKENELQGIEVKGYHPMQNWMIIFHMDNKVVKNAFKKINKRGLTSELIFKN